MLRVECPWDREQTAKDIVSYTVEEVFELADAVAGDDLAREHGELGDLLLQVVILAMMLAERDAGDLGSVAHDIEVKLVRRHPHIFADAVADTGAEVKARWERIKVEQEGREGIFHDVAAGSPALLYARKLQQRAAAVGFDWDSAAEAFPKIAEEHAELAEVLLGAAAGAAEGDAGGSESETKSVSKQRSGPRRPPPPRRPPRPTRPASRTSSATCSSPSSTSPAWRTSTPSSPCARRRGASSAASARRPRSPNARAATGLR